MITYVAPWLDHQGAVYVAIPDNGLIERAGKDRFVLTCNRKGCATPHLLSGGDIHLLVTATALEGGRSITFPTTAATSSPAAAARSSEVCR